jgi:translation initiation factor 2 subunit 3
MEALPEANLGLVGHVDHGKTTLAAALSGKWTDIHSEELKRGITIKLGYADFNLRKCDKCKFLTVDEKCPKCKGGTKLLRKLSIVDAPGHESLMAIMLSGAAIMDGAVLVIAANELCPQPQTQEHLMALKILGVERVIVAQNKVDLVSKEKALENYKQINKYIKDTLGVEPIIIPISAQKKVNINYLLEAVNEYIRIPERKKTADPLLYVARSFDINKPGTVIKDLKGGVPGAAISQGEFKVGDEIEIRPGIRHEKKQTYESVKTKIQSIVSGDTNVKKKGPGGSVAISTLLDPAVTKADSLSGNLVGKPGKLPIPVFEILFKPHLFDHVIGTKEKLAIASIKMNEPLMLSVSTATTLGVVNQATETIKANLKRPICTYKGDKLAISRQIQGRWRLIGYGIIV